MYSACVQDYAQWRDVARPLLSANIPPEEMEWRPGRGFEPLQDAQEFGRELIPLVREAVARRSGANRVAV